MICYYFYKNVVLVFTEVYFAGNNGFSGTNFFADWLPMLYNALWTSWQCLFSLMFERDIDDIQSLRYPQLYKAGQARYYFNIVVFWKWIALAILHGGLTFSFSMFGLEGPL